MKRITTITEYVRHNYTAEERLEMAGQLASAHDQKQQIDEEETSLKARIKDRKAQVDQTVGRLSREIVAGFTMKNVECDVKYDYPNAFEVSYLRKDTGDLVKTRPMNPDERQQDLPLEETIVVIPPEKSAENIQGFFKTEEAAPAEQEGPGTAEFEDQVRQSLGAPEPMAVTRMVGDTPRAERRRKNGLVAAD